MIGLLLDLIWSFFKIGLLSFGGGYATIAILRGGVVTRGWLTAAEFADVVAISQVTPGPVAVNAATFIGYRLAGMPGALAATFGVALPSFILVLCVMRFLKAYRESGAAPAIFNALKPAVAGLMAAALYHIARPELLPGGRFDARAAILFCAAAAAGLFTRVSPILILLAAALLGLLLWR